jgi:hypothetical protein
MTTSRRTKSKPGTIREAKPIDIEINVDEFTNADYEALVDWSSGSSSRPVSEIFDILDRVIVGGFRTRRFVDSKAIIQQMLRTLTEEATNQKN